GHDPAFDRLELRQVATLVRITSAGDQIELRILADRSVDEAGERRPLQVREMLAGEEGDEVGGRGDELAVQELHERLHGRGGGSGRINAGPVRDTRQDRVRSR